MAGAVSTSITTLAGRVCEMLIPTTVVNGTSMQAICLLLLADVEGWLSLSESSLVFNWNS